MERTILLIETDASLRRRYRKFLEFEGYRVVSASDVSSARQLACRMGIFDLVIAAVTPPSSAALESVLQELPNTPVLLIYEPDSPPEELPYPCVMKPVPPERLVFKVEQMLPVRQRAMPSARRAFS